MFLNYIGKPSVYLPACVMLWGAISLLTGHEMSLNSFTPLASCLCRHNSQLYGCPPHPILPWLRRGCLFPRCTLSPIKVVQELRAWSSHCIPLVRYPYEQCVWLAHGLRHSEWNAGKTGSCSMEVCCFDAVTKHAFSPTLISGGFSTSKAH
jgi:hypothetical protein